MPGWSRAREESPELRARAHSLSELLPPDESARHFPAAWSGCDRWYGQTMKQAQLNLFQRYHVQTPMSEIPPWAHGLRRYYGRVDLKPDEFMPWDYGLSKDLQLLCHHRRGPIPRDAATEYGISSRRVGRLWAARPWRSRRGGELL